MNYSVAVPGFRTNISHAAHSYNWKMSRINVNNNKCKDRYVLHKVTALHLTTLFAANWSERLALVVKRRSCGYRQKFVGSRHSNQFHNQGIFLTISMLYNFRSFAK